MSSVAPDGLWTCWPSMQTCQDPGVVGPLKADAEAVQLQFWSEKCKVELTNWRFAYWFIYPRLICINVNQNEVAFRIVELEKLNRLTRAQVNMCPHGGARWPREKGRGYTFQWESSFQKAANVPLEESVGQLAAVIARAETKGGRSMLSSGGRRIYVWVRPHIQVHCAEVGGNVCLTEKEEEDANKPARGSQVAVRTRTENHNKEHQPNLRPSAESGTGHHVRGKLLFAGWVLSPSLGECMNGDATGPLVLPDWQQWTSTH